MSEIINDVIYTLKPRIENSQSFLNEDCKLLLKRLFEVSLLDHNNLRPGTSDDIIKLQGCLLIVRLDIEAPIGFERTSGYYNWFVKTLEYLTPDLKISIFNHYKTAIFKELSNCKTIEEALIIANFINYMSSAINDLNFDSLKNSTYNILSKYFWQDLKSITEEPSCDPIIKLFTDLAKAINLKHNFLSLASNSAYIACKYIEKTNDLYGVEKYFKNNTEKNFYIARKITGALKLIQYNDQALLEKIDFIIGCTGEPEIIILDTEKQKINSSQAPSFEIDFSSWKFEAIIYANSKNEKYNINIYKYTTPQGFVATKEYTCKKSLDDMEKLLNEIKIMKKLSDKANENNCFLRFYGSNIIENKLYLYMEYHEKTLMDVITDYKKSNRMFDEGYLSDILLKLVSSFSEMEEMKILHQDIKPHNILMTDNNMLKIIDFSISEIKENFDLTINPTGMAYVQGTKGYMAPEVEKYYSENQKKGKIRQNKADVFSLGMTILQMYYLEDLHTLNLEENHTRLMDKVEGIKYNWLRTLLEKMLALDYHNRPRFKRLIKYFPSFDPTVSR